jgi:thiol:disulfide interchange protein
MTRFLKALLGVIFLGWFLVFSHSSYSQVHHHVENLNSPHASVKIISSHAKIRLGEIFYLGFLFDLEPEWHIYWKNPGDSGSALTAQWDFDGATTSTRVQTDEILWPLPELLPVGPLMNYGYKDQVLLPVPFRLESAEGGQKLKIHAQADWLICKIECLPASGDFRIELPVGKSGKPSQDRAIFEKTFSMVPPQYHFIASDFMFTENTLELEFAEKKGALFSKENNFYFFPNESFLIEHAAPQVWSVSSSGRVRGSVPLNSNASRNHASVQGVLAFKEKSEEKFVSGVEISAEPRELKATFWWIGLLFAFLGGMILNLMPCVFPVIGIKILGFVKSAGESRRKSITHGWLYALGIVFSFWLLSALLILLKAGGQQVGWGFQLQSPFFVSFLAILFFVLPLNFLGVFEWGSQMGGQVSGAVNRVGSRWTQGSSYFNSFLTGVLATIVATPCTAPFMGTAMGYAFTQNTFTIFLIFTFLGLGLSGPYVLLSYFPQLLKKLPRSGSWMIRFKEFLAFPLFLTSIWLLWVLSLQRGSELVLIILLSFVLFGFGLWVRQHAERLLGRMLSTFALLGALVLPFFFIKGGEVATAPSLKTEWQPYSKILVDELLDQNKAVFIDFTAAWCITCQVNKRVVLRQPEVLEAFQNKGVQLIEADWTNYNAEITEALASFGKVGVPLYVYYSEDQREEKIEGQRTDAVILPEILSIQMIYELLEKN